MSVRAGSLSEGAQLFKDRNVDVFTVSTGVGNATITDISASLPVRFISLPEDVIKKMISSNPGYRRLVIPAGTYRGQDQDLVTVSADGALLASTKMSDDQASQVTKVLAEHFGDL